jgi:hypothetical protein
MKSQKELFKTACAFIKSGICVIATGRDKNALVSWKPYEERIITEEEAKAHFFHPMAVALAVVCGKASGNLEVIDIDTKYDLTGSLFEDYMQAIRDNKEDLHERLLIIKTRSGGYHLYYRCPVIASNIKLARRYTTEEEKKNPRDPYRTLIETRGHAGYVVAPPSEGYSKYQGEAIPEITPEERAILFELAKTFNQVIDPPVTNHTSRGYDPKEYGLSPFEDYNNRGDLVGLLQGHGWAVVRETNEKVIFRRPEKDAGTSGNYNKDKKWFSVFSTSTIFDDCKAYLPYAVYAVLECNGDFKLAAKKLLELGYGEKREYFGSEMEQRLYQRKREGKSKEDLVEFVKNEYPKNTDKAKYIVEKLTRQWGEKYCTFWDIDEKMRPRINRNKLIDFLHYTGGFSLYYYDPASTIFKIVRCENGFLEEVSSEHIKKFLKNYIENLPETFDGGITSHDLMELILKGSDTYFSKSILEFLNRGHYDFLKDTATEAFFPFQNGIVRITKDKIDLVGYKEIDKVIWRRQVIDYNVQIIDCSTIGNVEYADFLNKISGDDENRFTYASTLIGYLLHKYKDFSRPWAVVLAEESENESEGGGTGKGIFVTALSKFLSTERIDGKNFKLDKNFAFQRVALDTRFVAIEDCRKNVDFEGFYSIITEGITVEKKNKDELFIPFKDAPKIMFTTNYTISPTSNAGKRRIRLFEFSNFFSPERTPAAHFGHNLFDDWDKDEWNRFYNFGFACVSEYLKDGIAEMQATDKIKRKNLRIKYTPDFLEWWDEYSQNGCDQWKMASDLYHSFLNQYEIEKKDYAQTKFGRALNEAAQTLSFSIERRKNNQAGNKVEMRMLRKPQTVSANTDS